MNRSDIKKLISENYSELLIHEFESCLVVSAFPFKYERFLELQEELTPYIKKTGDKVLICCNHRSLATMGRGDRQNAHLENKSVLPDGLEVFNIKRGGGITLHHPGQWIFYPIVRLDSDKWSLTNHMCWMIGIVKTILKQYGLETKGLRNPLGVWFEDKKLASIGVGVNRFVSNHGLALNVKKHQLTAQEFALMNPCGLNAQVYSSVEECVCDQVDVDNFQERFISLIDQKGQQDLHLLVSAPDCRFD